MNKQTLEAVRDIVNTLLELPEEELQQNNAEVSEVLEQINGLLSGKAAKDYEKNEARRKEEKIKAEIAKDIENFNKFY